MSPQYATPGVYIEEVTGPGVIAGVGTSTAAFVGPAAKGPIGLPTRVTSLDDFVRLYGGSRDGRAWPYLYGGSIPSYLGFAVEAFFRNGGTQAFVVRIGTAVQASLPIANRAAKEAAVVRALAEGTAGDGVSVAVESSAVLTVATGSSTLTAVASTAVTVLSAAPFRVGDQVTTDGTNRAEISQVQGATLTLSAQLAGASVGDTLRIADLLKNGPDDFRLVSTQDLVKGATVLVNGVDRAVIDHVNAQTGFAGLVGGPPKKYTTSPTAPTLTTVRLLVTGSANVSASATAANPSGNLVSRVTVDDASPFVPGDTVTSDGTHVATIDRIQGSDLWLAAQLAGIGAKIRLADVAAGTTTFRLDRTAGLAPGSVLLLSDGNAAHDSYVVLQSVTPAGLVTIASAPAIGAKLSLAVAAGSEPTAMSQEFRLVVTPPATSAAAAERIEPLSLEPTHPRNVLNAGVVASDWVEVVAPATPPGTTAYPGALAQTASGAALTGGQDDQPQALTSVDFQGGLDTLRDVDDVNLVVVPDAASHAERQTIQEAMIDHCLAMADRFAILDSAPGAPPYGPGSVEEQRSQVTADRGFAALYYPWLIVRDPLSSGPLPRTMTVPPSGAIAGVYARTDQERGVHKAPANTDVRGVLGLEQRLSDRLQGPLNLEGVNVLRIFPGNAQVIVWGARTTVEPDVTDWLYVNVRRLLLYIEESIQEGIRWAVFEGNDLSLWQKLNRTISAFLTGVWRDGGLFGAKAEDAFQVRIDEALNPPSERALGRLHIEIQVAPVRPAEFIVVRIGLWDGGDDVSES